MSRKLSFSIGDVDILVEEGDFDGDGITDLKFTVTVDESGGQTADLRGLFWDVADESKLGGLDVWAAGSPDITDHQFDPDAVHDLGNGANMNGAVKKHERFDAGVEIGTQGIGKDDIQSTSFVIRGTGDLTLDDIGGMRFGVRLTSVGDIDGDREDSLKLLGIAPHAPDAEDDCLVTDEDTPAGLNLLLNDTDDDGDPLTVIGIEGGSIGAQFAVTSDGGRDALVTVNADGSFSIDPNGNFEDLSTGDSDGFTLIYTISDGNGGEDCAEVKVVIEGVNDAPVANDDPPFFVEYGDTTLQDVAANDTDVDGTVDASTLAFSGATLGVAVEIGGKLSYSAIPIAYDTTDSSALDAFTYTVKDNEGLESAPGPLLAQVIDPMRETATDSTLATNSQLLELILSTEDRTYNTSSFVEVDITSGGLSQAVNVSFVLDGSGSVSGSEYAQQRLAVQNTIDALRADYAGSAATVTVQLVQFASDAQQASYDLFSASLDNVAVGTPISNQTGGSTDYNAALTRADNFFAAVDPGGVEDNFMLFASDGNPNNGGGYGDHVANLNARGVSITAVGFGTGITLSTLNGIDNTGGAQIVPNAAGLGDVFADSPLFPADLIEFELSVDGSVVATLGDLNPLGGGDYDFAGLLSGLFGATGGTNNVEAVARFDTDNDGIWDEERFAETFIQGTDGSDVIFA